MLLIDIDEVEFLPTVNDNLAGSTSDSTPLIFTLFCSWCIPWFLWSTVKCKPSLTSVIFSIEVILAFVFEEPTLVFNDVIIPVTGCVYVNFPPTTKSPWTLSSTSSSVLPIETIDNLAFLPESFEPPSVVIPRTSPCWNPLPEVIILTDEIPPSVTTTSAVMKSPPAVMLVRATPTCNPVPDAGEYPKPALAIPILPVPIPALPTKSPDAFDAAA